MESARCFVASVSAINDVIMNQCRHVDELKDHPNGQVVGFYATGSATYKNGQDRADAFAAGVADIIDVRGDGRIEGTYLISNLSLYIFELLLDQLEWYFGRRTWLSGGHIGTDIKGFCGCKLYTHRVFCCNFYPVKLKMDAVMQSQNNTEHSQGCHRRPHQGLGQWC